MTTPQPYPLEIQPDWEEQVYGVNIQGAKGTIDFPTRLEPEQDWLDHDWEKAFTIEAPDPSEFRTTDRDSPSKAEIRRHEDWLLRLYLRDAQREPLLSEEEERRVIWSARFGDAAARDRLVLGNLRFVVHLACRYRGLGLALADLVNEGNLGLMTAAERYDSLAGARFATYAAGWIRQRMVRALDNQARTVRQPANYTQLRRQVREAEMQIQQALGREADDQEVATACRLRVTTVRRLRGDAGREYSLDAPGFPNGDGRLADLLPDDHALPPDESLATTQDFEQLAAAMATLTPREQQILHLRYGLDDGQPRTLAETGQALGLLRQRVHQLETSALAKLRQRF